MDPVSQPPAGGPLSSPAAPLALGRPSAGTALAAGAGLGLAALVAAAAGLEAGGLALLALAAGLATFARPALAGPLVALLLPAPDAVDVAGMDVAPLDAVVGGVALGYLARLAARREPLRIGWADWAFAALVAFMAVSVLGPVDDSSRARDLLVWAALGVVLHAVREHLADRRDVVLMLVALVAALVFEAGFALYEYVDAWSDRTSVLGGAIVYPLPEGTLLHANALAQFLVLTGFLVLALGLAQEGALRRLTLVAVALGGVALVVTFSRASWIACAAGACVYLAERRTRRPVLAIGGAALAVGAVLAVTNAGAVGARFSSLFSADTGDLSSFRLRLVERASELAADHPFTGAGVFNEVGIYAGRPDLATHPHNLFLGVAVFFGIPAALAFAALVALAARSAWRAWRREAGPARLTALGCLAFLGALLVNGLLEYPFWNASLTALVVLGLAVALSLDRRGPAAA